MVERTAAEEGKVEVGRGGGDRRRESPQLD